MNESPVSPVSPQAETLSLEEAKVAFALLEERIVALNERFDRILVASLTREMTATTVPQHGA